MRALQSYKGFLCALHSMKKVNLRLQIAKTHGASNKRVPSDESVVDEAVASLQRFRL